MEAVEIIAYYEAAADAKLEKLARRGAKYGQAIAWRKEPFVRVEKRKRWDGKAVDREVPMIRYHVEGEAPRVGDFVFLAELELVPGAGVIIAGKEVGALGREWKGECQHCGKNRARRNGYVVEGADGKRLVVGKACLRDYVGRDVPAGALWLFQFERMVAGFPMEEGLGGGGGRWEDELLGVVAAARAVIALYGWAPKAADGYNSADRVGFALWPLMGAKPGSERVQIRDAVRAELKANGDHYEAVAREVIEWGRALEPRNDYENNLKVALAAELVDAKRFGLVVSAAAAFDKQKAREADRVAAAKAREAQRADDVNADWFGEPGGKYEAELEMKAARRMPASQWGESVLYEFRGPAGEVIKWFCSGAAPRLNGKPIEAGDRFKAKFAVKKHGEYQGIKEAVVLRLKVA